MTEIYQTIGGLVTLAALIIGFFYLIRQAINLIEKPLNSK